MNCSNNLRALNPIRGKQHATGFTLIEIVVVIFIIGTVIAAATLSFGDSQADRMKHKSEQIAAVIDYAKERAIFNSDELGIYFTDNSYTFYKLESERNDKNELVIKWETIDSDKLLNERTLPDGLTFEVYLEGAKVVFTEKEEVEPHIYIFSDGTVTPFEVTITDHIDHSHNLIVAENGDFEFKAVN